MEHSECRSSWYRKIKSVPLDKAALSICFMCTRTFTAQGGFPAGTNQMNLAFVLMPPHCTVFCLHRPTNCLCRDGIFSYINMDLSRKSQADVNPSFITHTLIPGTRMAQPESWLFQKIRKFPFKSKIRDFRPVTVCCPFEKDF
jgi:hypothetical protein